MRRLPMWVPESVEGEGWLLVFPDGAWIAFEEDQQTYRDHSGGVPVKVQALGDAIEAQRRSANSTEGEDKSARRGP